MMNNITALPLLGDSMSAPTQRDLFGDAPAPIAEAAGVFADIVFDRPLDHAYTYRVPEALQAVVAVGKRVLAPLGRGDKATVGYCVGVRQSGPETGIKDLTRVIDDDPLLTPHLLRLTRWLADYYLCSWGQVLTAIVPAGARKQAGTRTRAFLEAIPADKLPEPLPTLTAKQTAALEALRKEGKPVEPVRLAQQLQCGLGPIEALVTKGVARRVQKRVDRFAPAPDEDPLPEQAALTLNGDQHAAHAAIDQAVQAGGFHAFLLHGVTGSGKTEIYLRAIEQCVQQGKQAIVLVPEISLTLQTIQRCRGRFT